MSHRYRMMMDSHDVYNDSIIYKNESIDFVIIEVDENDEDFIKLREQLNRVPVKKKGRPKKEK